MEKLETLRQRVVHQQQILARLRLATVRLADAQLERTWAIVCAHEQGLSIRQIASATDLSSSRIHQLLTIPDAQAIPQWLSYLPEPEEPEGEQVGSPSPLGNL